MNLTFLNPAAFFALFLIPLLFILRKIGLFSKTSFALTISDWGGKTFSWNSGRFFSFVSSFCFLISFVFLVASFADPVIRKKEKIYTSKGSEILFVLDTSISMAARDMSFMNAPLSRLDAARRSIRTILEKKEGTSFALVAVASDAALVVPSTSDVSLFLERLDSLEVGSLGDGSALGTGISSGVYHLVSSRAPKKAVVLLTDGENNAGAISPLTAAQIAKSNGISLYILGIGTNGTVPLEYKDRATGKIRSVLYESAFDGEPLREIAHEGGGKYFGIESLGELSDSLLKIVEKEKTVQSFVFRTIDEELYATSLLFSLVFFVIFVFIRKIFLKEIL